LTEPFERALDVGCGTGLSTIALKEIASRVAGLDSSAAMLALAPEKPGIEYLLAEAEHLPFENCVFDLVTASQAIHWFGKAKFFPEAGRVLRTHGWLIVYDHCFAGSENRRFNAWLQEAYPKRYPTPPREWTSFSKNEIKAGFQVIDEEVLSHRISFSLDGWIDYLTTQSNIIASVEGGKEMIDEARGWLNESLKAFFRSEKQQDLLFSAPIWYLQRIA
jgi:ubiquinone/menaquinone biosynthesis C-methylase UbiE